MHTVIQQGMRALAKAAICLLVAAGVAFPLAAGTDEAFAAEPNAATSTPAGKLTIMHTNDIHGRYKASGGDACIGLSAIKALTDAMQPDLLLDAGDTFHGLSFATVQKGESIAQLMQAAGYDATTPGNHDWSYGAAQLSAIDSGYSFDILAANVLTTDGQPYFAKPYLIKDVTLSPGKTIKVGVLGVIDSGFYTSTPAQNVVGLQFTDPVAAANAAAQQLRESEGCAIVIALTHNRDPQAFARQTSGIDAVIAGHEHIVINDAVTNADGKAVPVVEAGYYLRNVGRLTLNLEQDENGSYRVASSDEVTFTSADTAEYSNTGVDSLVQQIEAEEATILNEVIGTSSQAYPFSWEGIRTTDQAIGHVVTAAYLDATGADIALENAGGVRGGIPQGTVTANDMLSISPFGNTLATYELSGADVLSLLERSLEISHQCNKVYDLQKQAVEAGEDPYQYAWPDNSGSVLVPGGATLTIDWSKPAGQRILSAQLGGAPLDAARTYAVAMNSYLPSLTAEYPALANMALLKEWGTCEEALRAFVGASEWEDRVYPLSGTVTYYVPEDEKAGGEVPKPLPDGDAQDKNNARALAATGDPTASAVQSLSALCALMGAAAVGAARMRRTGNAGCRSTERSGSVRL